MLVDKVELLLPIGLPLEQLAEDSQAEGPMGERRFAGFFQGVAGVTIREAHEALQHANPVNPAVFEHCFGPARGLRADPAHLTQPPRGSMLYTADLLGRDVLRLRAETARLPSNVDRELLEPVVEDAYQPRVPAGPDRASQVFGRGGVVRLGHLDMAIAVDDPLALVKEGKPLPRQRLKRGPLDLLERLAELLLRGPVDPRLGHRLFPFEQVPVLRLQTVERVTLQPVVLGVAHAPLDLPFVTGRVRLARQDLPAVMLAERLELGGLAPGRTSPDA